MTRCYYCGYEGEIIWVHGHGQCARCHTNIDPCCQGVPDPGPQEERPPAPRQKPGPPGLNRS
jgi:hypothetical protein